MTQYIKAWYEGRSNWQHRVVWEKKYGKIPRGFHLHHKDGNKENNDISNLECLSRQEHRALHTVELKKRVFYCVVCGKKFSSGSYLLPKFCSNHCRQKDYVASHRVQRNAYRRKWRLQQKLLTS